MPWYNGKFFIERDKINVTDVRFNEIPPILTDAYIY